MMTVIVGVKAGSGINGRVLAADTQLTEYDGDEPISKTQGVKKLVSGDYWAMGFSGVKRSYLRDFFRSLKADECSVENAVETGYFREVNELSRRICKEYGEDDLVKFLLVSSKPKLGLYCIDLMGNVNSKQIESDEGDYMMIGSGSTSAGDYLEEKLGNDKDYQDGVTLEKAIDLAWGSIKEGNHDIFTGGPIDLIVVTDKYVKDFGASLKQVVRRAEIKALENVKEKVIKLYNEGLGNDRARI